MKWEWFLGGKVMFWTAIVFMIIIVICFTMSYLLDPTTKISMKVLDIDSSSIQDISETYIKDLKVIVDKPIVYRFVRYNCNGDVKTDEEMLLGTFHEWNDTYYIDILVDLYKTDMLKAIVIHETRHMLVEYMKDKNIIDLTKYTEDIAQEYNNHYNNLFDSGIYLLREYQKN